MHVIADVLTSVFALVALLAGRYIGWSFLDPVMGIVGGLLILRWAYNLIVSSGKVLLDGGIETELRETIRSRLESDNESRVADLQANKGGKQRGHSTYRCKSRMSPLLSPFIIPPVCSPNSSCA